MVGMESWVPGNHRHHTTYGGFGAGGGTPSADPAANVASATTEVSSIAIGGSHAAAATRSSLGKLIERSTSAPPPSSSFASEGYYNVSNGGKPYGGLSVVGGNLLEQLTRNYSADPTSIASSSSLRDLVTAPHSTDYYYNYTDDANSLPSHPSHLGPLDNGGGGYPLKDTPSNQDLMSLLGNGSTNSGRSTAPMSDASTSAASASTLPPGRNGRSAAVVGVDPAAEDNDGATTSTATGSAYYESSSLFLGGHHDDDDHLVRRSPFPGPSGLFRSQSAAPAIGPPPGLGLSSSLSSPTMGTFRSASASGTGGGLPRMSDAVPHSHHPRGTGHVHNSFGGGGGGSAMGMSIGGGGALRPAAKTPLDLIQEDFPAGNNTAGHNNSFDSYERTTATSPPRPTPTGSPQKQEQHPSHGPESSYGPTGGVRSADYRSPPRSHSVPAEMQQQRRESPPHATASGQQLSHPSLQGQQPTYHQRGSAVLQQQQPQEQPVYFHHQQQLQHQQPPQPSHMVHSQGQTLYVNGPIPGAQSQPYPTHGYATIHYHTSSSQPQQQPQRLSPTHMQPNQMAQIIQHHQPVHQNVGGGMGGEQRYISLVPVPSNGGVLPTQGVSTAYWQPPPPPLHDAIETHPNHMGHPSIHVGANTALAMDMVEHHPHTMTIINGGAGSHPHHGSAMSGGAGRGGGHQVLSNSVELAAQQPYYVADPYSHRQGGSNAVVGHVPGGTSNHRQQQHPRDKTAARDGGGQGGRGRRGQSGGSSGSGSGGPGGGGRRAGNESKHPTCSLKLEEFRAMKNRDWTMHEIAGYVVEFCQDQNGSRFIQQRLEMGDAAEQQVVAKEVLPAIRRLRNDVFGNYVVQKLLDFGSPQVRAEIRDTLEGEMLQLSLQMYGCRVVQKALESLGQDDVSRLLIEFHHNVLSCIHDQNGNHVIQKCIEVVSKRAKKERCVGADDRADHLNRQIKFIIDDVLHNTVSLSCHPYGCRVLQRILEHCDEDRKERVLTEIKKCHRKLLDDQYGNYVIQHVLQYGRVTDRDAILSIVVESGLLRLSRQKFASNVVEKLLKYGNDRHICAIVREMLKQGDDPSRDHHHSSTTNPASTVVLHMVRDAYANYVVQTTLDVVPEPSEERTLLIQELNNHSDELRQYTFAKHIVAKLVSLNGGSL